jgi:BlaI family penicillinase repressor
MTRTGRPSRPRLLGAAEQLVMDHVWAHGPVSAEACREGLQTVWPMKDSTMRTVLKRLEEKGFVTHTTEGRTFMYTAVEAPASVAGRTVKHLLDRFCGGSAEALLMGMVNADVLTPQQLERLAAKIAAQATHAEPKK